MTSIYRPILKMAWQILWRAKYLWFFGLLAVLVSNGGELSLVMNNFSSVSESSGALSELKVLYLQGALGNFFGNISALFANFNLAALALVLILLVVFILLLWLAITWQAGLIHGAYKEYRKQPAGFLPAFKVGRQSFWRVLGINIVGKVVIYGLLFIVGLPLTLIYLRQSGEAMQNFFVILAFIILIPLAVIVSFLIKYAVIFAVLKKEKIGQAIKSGWNLFIKNWVVSIEMAITMFLVGVVAAIVFVLAVYIINIPLALLFNVFVSAQVPGMVSFTYYLSVVLFFVILFLVAAWLSVYQMTSWVLLYDRLTESQVFSKLARLVASLTGRNKNTTEEIS